MFDSDSLTSTRFVICLFRFMLLFEINRFQILDTSDKVIAARVGWADDGSPDYDEAEEIQDIEWDIQQLENMEDALEVAEYLIDNKIMRSDKITIDENELHKRLGWEKYRCEIALNSLLKIKVDMLDEGKRTDYFFIHF